MRTFPALFACTALLAGSAAAAENAIAPAKLLAEPTFENVGLELTYTGDANFNAAAKLQYRKAGEAAWRNGHPFARISDAPMDPGGKGARNPRFATSAMFLEEDTEYEVQAVVEDPDGVKAQLPPVKVRTLNSKVPTGGGKDLYADPKAAPGGDGSKAKPFASLADALNAGGPGDTVHFLPGVYHFTGNVECKASGSEKAYLYLKAEPGAVLTDADPAISGVGKLKAEAFKKDVDGHTVYKADLKDVSRMMVRKKPGDARSGYLLWKMAADSRGPYTGQTLDDMLQDIPHKNAFGSSLQAEDALYFVLPEGIDLAAADVQVARLNRSEILFTGHHVVVEGFTIELSAALRVQGRAPAGHFVFRRLDSYSQRHHGSTDTVVNIGDHGLLEDSTFTLNAFWDWYSGPKARDGAWMEKFNNKFGDIRGTWCQTKAGYNDSYTVNCGAHSTLRYNTFVNHTNALHTRNPNSVQEHRNIDIHHNLVLRAGDDAIEPEGPGVNLRIYENRVEVCLNGISDAPLSVGPAFIVRNVFFGYIQGAFKVRNGGAGATFYYHNACYPNMKDIKPYSDNPDGETCYAPDPEGIRWMRLRNNVLVGKRGPGHLNTSRFSKPMIDSLDFDWNLLWAQTGKPYKTMMPEAHSVFAEPKFADAEKGDLRMTGEAPPGLDAGDLIKGINDEVPAPYQFQGKAPDMALYELGTPAPHYGPRDAAKEVTDRGSSK